MRKTTLCLIAVFVATAGAAEAAIEEAYEENPIKIQKAGFFDEDKQVKIRIGNEITFEITVFQSEFFGHTTVSANAHIGNDTSTKVVAVYSISFHDKNGKLVGCHQGSWDLEPNDDANYGSGIIYADVKSISSVTSYKLKTQAFESKK